jgi:hypothetical protein
MKNFSILSLSLMGLLTVISASAHSSVASRNATKNHSNKAEAVVDPNGNLRVPADYRTSYQFLGSWAIANDKGQGSKGIHVVYASPGALEAYRKDGHFPDGSVLVKEVYEAATGKMTTGTVSHAQKLQGWFVMVKDSKNSHPGNDLWGDGWGWSWFNADDPSKTTSSDYRIQCLTCHEPVRDTDLVYVQGYPPLHGAH